MIKIGCIQDQDICDIVNLEKNYPKNVTDMSSNELITKQYNPSAKTRSIGKEIYSILYTLD